MLYPQPGILDDGNGEERALGIAAGLAGGRRADLTAVYVDRGISSGMLRGIEAAREAKRPLEFRSLNGAKSIDELAQHIL